jgi:hypothetical protein
MEQVLGWNRCDILVDDGPVSIMAQRRAASIVDLQRNSRAKTRCLEAEVETASASEQADCRKLRHTDMPLLA